MYVSDTFIFISIYYNAVIYVYTKLKIISKGRVSREGLYLVLWEGTDWVFLERVAVKKPRAGKTKRTNPVEINRSWSNSSLKKEPAQRYRAGKGNYMGWVNLLVKGKGGLSDRCTHWINRIHCCWRSYSVYLCWTLLNMSPASIQCDGFL